MRESIETESLNLGRMKPKKQTDPIESLPSLPEKTNILGDESGAG